MSETMEMLFFISMFILMFVASVLVIISVIDVSFSYLIKGDKSDIEIVLNKNYIHTDSYTISMPPPNPDIEVSENDDYSIILQNSKKEIKKTVLDREEYNSYYIGEKVKVTYLETFLGFDYVVSVNHINSN